MNPVSVFVLELGDGSFFVVKAKGNWYIWIPMPDPNNLDCMKLDFWQEVEFG